MDGGLLFGDPGHGPDFAEVDDVEQLVGRLDRFPHADVALGDDSGDGGVEGDDRGRIAGLAALDLHEELAGLDVVALDGIEPDDAAGDAAAEDGVAGGDFLDAPDGEDGGLEVGFDRIGQLDAEVLDHDVVESDHVGELVRIDLLVRLLAEGGDGCRSRAKMMGFSWDGLGYWAMAASKRTRAWWKLRRASSFERAIWSCCSRARRTDWRSPWPSR